MTSRDCSMNEQEIRESLYDFVRGRLSEAQAREIEARVASSDSLRRELEAVKAYYASLDGMEPVAVSGDFLEKVHERIAARGLFGKLFFPLHSKIPFEIAGVAATVLVIVFLYAPYVERMPAREDAFSAKTETVALHIPVAAAEKPATQVPPPASEKMKDASFPREPSLSSKAKSPATVMRKTRSAPKRMVRAAGEEAKSCIAASSASSKQSSPSGQSLAAATPSQLSSVASPAPSSVVAPPPPSDASSSPSPEMEPERELMESSAASVSPSRSVKEDDDVDSRAPIIARWNYSMNGDFSRIEDGSRKQSATKRYKAESDMQTVRNEELEAAPANAKQSKKKDFVGSPRRDPEDFLNSLIAGYQASATVIDSASVRRYSIFIAARHLASFLSQLRGHGTLHISGRIPSETSSEMITVILEIVRP